MQKPSSVCMEDGECKKKFPKEFGDKTAENINGYPTYHRRNNGRTVQIGGFVAARSPSYSTILLVAMKRSST